MFLHPQTSEEYALARTERKTGRGYHGFAFDTAPQVTLEDDLQRRDLTINAMAEDEHGALIDPFGGAADLRGRLLRHVSPAFAEDPVRVLRVARFAARYASRGFRVAGDAGVDADVHAGEVDHLQAERVGRKAKARRARSCRRCANAVRSRRCCPRSTHSGVPQRAEYHPDTGVHVGMVLDMAARLAPGDALIGWCALTHDLGKALTPSHKLPSHHGHEHAGVAPLEALCTRLKVPSDYAALALLVCRLHLLAHTALELKPSTVLGLLEQLDSFRRPERLDQFLLACEADRRGRLGLAEADYPQAAFLRRAHTAAAQVDAQPFIDGGLAGPAIGTAIRDARVRAIAALDKT